MVRPISRDYGLLILLFPFHSYPIFTSAFSDVVARANNNHHHSKNWHLHNSSVPHHHHHHHHHRRKSLRSASITNFPAWLGQRPCRYQPTSRHTLLLHVHGGANDIITSNDNNNNNDDDDNTKDLAVQGRFLLCMVALLYGTLNVSLRLVYQLPIPPSAAAMSATRGWIASVCFLPLLFLAKKPSTQQQDQEQQQQQQGQSQSPSNSFSQWLSTPLLLAGLELAVWNALAQGLLNVGLLSTSSARASFLTQTSVLLTPLISILAGQSIAKGTWIACGIALMGLVLLSGGGGLVLAFSTGDLLVLGGALAWSCYLLRLSQIGSRFDEINLQFLKTVVLAFLYSAWFLTSIPLTGANILGNIPDAMKWAIGPGALAAWAALVFSAVGPGIAADVLQQQGQRHVTASEANVLLSMEPVFAAVFARILLGEVTTVTEAIGGGLILLAALIASTTNTGKVNEGETMKTLET